MASGDKVVSWSDFYKQINNIIDMFGSSATKLTVNEVASGASIDDTDVNNITTTINVLKTNTNLSTTKQLDASSHKENTFDLFGTLPQQVTKNELLKDLINNQKISFFTKLNQVKCNNITSCTHTYSASCSNGCSQSYYTAYYTTYCDHCYGSVCYGHNMCSGQSCSPFYGTTWCSDYCISGRCMPQAQSASYTACSQSTCNNAKTTTCNPNTSVTHVDILCNNSTWSGS